MLMRGDFDLNSMQTYEDSNKEVLQHTMLNQELVFRKQVHELHRLYSTQKSLMEDLSWKEFNDFNSWKTTTQLHASSINYNRLPEERAFSSMPLAGSTQSTDQDLLPDYQRRPLDLRLPAEHYGSYQGNDFQKRDHVWNIPEESGQSKYSLLGENVSDPGKMKLSLCIGEEDTGEEDLRITRHGKKTYSCSQDVIDLEDSSPSLGFAVPTIGSRYKHDSQVSVWSQLFLKKCEKKDPVEVITLSDDSGNCPEWNSLNPGSVECCDDLPCENLLKKKQRMTSSGLMDIDLNKVQLDDSSCYSNDPLVAYPSTASSSGVLHGLVGESGGGACRTPTCLTKINSNCSVGTSDVHQQNRSLNPDLADSDKIDSSMGSNKARNVKCEEYCGTVMGSMDLESVSGSPLEPFENPRSCSSNLENESMDLPLEVSNNLFYGQHSANILTKQVNVEGTKEQDNASLAPYQSQDMVQAASSSCVGDNNSCSVKTTLSKIQQGDSNLSASNKFSEIPLGSEVAETASGEQDVRSSNSRELKHLHYSKKEETAELDVLIKKAAESLVHLSVSSSASYPDCASNSGSMKINDMKEQPEYSLDSYEANVLNITENVDDYTVTSNPSEVNEMEKKDFGVKLRRGRRMKDFQKDILPGLASLSRQEIREDINIMEGVIRSREYRKIQAKLGNGINWSSTPVRSRRSQRNYIGRRNYS